MFNFYVNIGRKSLVMSDYKDKILVSLWILWRLWMLKLVIYWYLKVLVYWYDKNMRFVRSIV